MRGGEDFLATALALIPLNLRDFAESKFPNNIKHCKIKVFKKRAVYCFLVSGFVYNSIHGFKCFSLTDCF